MEFLIEYGLFLAKIATVLLGIGILVSTVVNATQKSKPSAHNKGHLEITPLNQQFDDMSEAMLLATLDESRQKVEVKRLQKEKKKQAEQLKKASKASGKSNSEDTVVPAKRRLFVLKFDGNISASAVTNLRQEITAVLTQATPNDEVLIKLESTGGMVHSYGFASSQLDRLRKHNIPLIICIDKVAASGGYMMACVADKILAAPFAIVGSIGVVAQMPNFNRLLKKHDVDFDVLTAGEHKRTLTVFGENTEKGRQKFVEDLEETHQLFKEYVSERRSQIDITEVATGEVWYGTRALEVGLVDELQTSDEYLMSQVKEADVYEIAFVQKRKLHQKLGIATEESADRLLLKWWHRLTQHPNQQY